MKGVINCCNSSKDGLNVEKKSGFPDKQTFNTTSSAKPLIETQPLTWKFWQKRR